MAYEFEGFTLDPAQVELTAQDGRIPLEPKCYDLLLFLVENRDRVVTKDEIFDQVWPGVFVSEASISSTLKQLRRALGDDGSAQRFIRTVRGKGFRFVAPTVKRGAERPATVLLPDPIAPPEPIRQGGRPVLAVLPFSLIHSDPSQSAIAEGVPAELISALSRLRAVKVIARASTFRFDPASLDFNEIHARLGAAYALTGSVELLGPRLTVTAELTDTRSHRVVWSEVYSGSLDEIFVTRQEIVRAVCSAVEMHIPLNEAESLERVPTENLDAWGHYHLGIRHLFRFRQSGHEIARHHMEEAIARDPSFARAYSALAYAELEHYNLFFTDDPQRSLSRGTELAERATQLDPLDPFCNLVLGRANWISGDVDSARGWVDRSVALNPNYAFGHYELGKFNAITCDGVVADQHASTAMSLSPIDPHIAGMISSRSLAAFVRNDPEAALKYADLSVQATNPHLYVYVVAAAVYSAFGAKDRADHAVEKIGQSYKGFYKERFWTLFTLRDADRHAAMVRALDQIGLR